MEARLFKIDADGYIRFSVRVTPQVGKVLQREATRNVLTIPALCRVLIDEGLKRRILENKKFFGIEDEKV